jgi:GxxExxY protein
MLKMWTIRKDLIEKDLSYSLVGIFFEIHKELGRFCRERQYGDALELELRKNNIEFNREALFPVAGRLSNRIDFIIHHRIIIDIKAKPMIVREDYNQMKRYLHGANVELGMIVNFHETYLRPRRILKPRQIPNS